MNAGRVSRPTESKPFAIRELLGKARFVTRFPWLLWVELVPPTLVSSCLTGGVRGKSVSLFTTLS